MIVHGSPLKAIVKGEASLIKIAQSPLPIQSVKQAQVGIQLLAQGGCRYSLSHHEGSCLCLANIPGKKCSPDTSEHARSAVFGQVSESKGDYRQLYSSVCQPEGIWRSGVWLPICSKSLSIYLALELFIWPLHSSFHIFDSDDEESSWEYQGPTLHNTDPKVNTHTCYFHSEIYEEV